MRKNLGKRGDGVFQVFIVEYNSMLQVETNHCFPDEGYWMLKPQNAELWWKTVLQWFDQYLKPGSP